VTSADRHPPVTELGDVGNRLGSGRTPHDHRRVRLLDRFGPRPRRLELHMVTVEGRLLFGPQGLHGQDVLAQDRPPLQIGRAVVRHLFLVPAVTDPEKDPPLGDDVERRHLLGEPDRIALRNKGDPGPKPNGRSHRSSRGQGNKLIVGSPVVVRQQCGALHATPGSTPTHRDVAVFRVPQGLESEVLNRLGEFHGLDRLVGREDRYANMHRGEATGPVDRPPSYRMLSINRTASVISRALSKR
jgi:hypothetical protein